MFTLLLLLLLMLLLVLATAFRVNRTKVMKLKELKPRLPTPPETFFVEIDFFLKYFLRDGLTICLFVESLYEVLRS